VTDPGWSGPVAARGSTGKLLTAITVGQQSLTEALGVGVLIEEKMKSSLVTAIDLSLAYPDLVQVYSSLLAASDNHLEAFQRTLPTNETDDAP